ncbi:MAG: sigma-70 family RNA polymerase sigma factor [Clostridia bacterium]|nr:sigma-70 family RNA polymerase sigma factor [Clostridia bacterium]
MNMISQNEFDQIIVELIYTKPAKYDALCAAATALLEKPLRRKFTTTPALAATCTYEDVLSEVYIRLIKSAVPSFFYRNETLNDDCSGFCKFVYTVAANICRDKIRYYAAHTSVPIETDDEDAIPLQISDPTADKMFHEQENIEILRQAFETVLLMDAQVYKIITWVAQAVMILSEGVSKIESNDLLVSRYEKMTLDSMWAEIRRAADKLSWLKVSESVDAHLRKILDSPFNSNVRYGDMRYADFFMKKGAKASISDWVNRINSVVRRENSWNT